MHITFVKKILADGTPCKKCAVMIYKLEASGHIEKINTTIIAQEGDLQSEGYILAKTYHQDNAPFFLVMYDDGRVDTISTYNDFLNIVLKSQKTL